MARQLRALGGTGKILSVERDPECVGWARRLVAHAECDSIVTVLEGTAESCLPAMVDMLGGEGKEPVIDVLFIDHDKEMYLHDLLLLEKSGLMRKGCVVIADNVVVFGLQQDYLTHVRGSGKYSSSVLHESSIEYSLQDLSINVVAPSSEEPVEDGVEISIYSA